MNALEKPTMTMDVESFLALCRRYEQEIERAKQEGQRWNSMMQEEARQKTLWRDLTFHFAGGIPPMDLEIPVTRPTNAWTPELKERWTGADDVSAKMQQFITPFNRWEVRPKRTPKVYQPEEDEEYPIR